MAVVTGSADAATSVLPLLKRLYPNGIGWNGFKKSKALGDMSKDTNFGGEGKYVNISLGPTQGGSANYQTAYANQGPTTEERFFVTHRTEYQLARIKGSAIARSMGDKNAILRIVKHEFDRAGYAFGRSMAAAVWGNGGGSLGIIDSTTTLGSTSLVLSKLSDVRKFEPGTWIQLSSDDGTGTSPAGVRDGGKQLQVLSIDATTKTLNLSANINTISGAAVADYVFRAGDYGVKMTGIPGWVVAGTVTSTAFYGVDRTQHRVRLAGYYHDGGGKPKEQTLIDACAEAMLLGAEPRKFWLNPLDYRDLLKEVGSDRVVPVNTEKPGISYKALEFETPNGTATLVSEGEVPQGECYGIEGDNMELATAGECPRLLDFDGNGRLMRVQGEDAVGFEIGAYGNFCVKNTGDCIAIKW